MKVWVSRGSSMALAISGRVIRYEELYVCRFGLARGSWLRFKISEALVFQLAVIVSVCKVMLFGQLFLN